MQRCTASKFTESRVDRRAGRISVGIAGPFHETSTIALVAILFDSSDIKGDATKALRSIIDEEFIPTDLEVGIIRTDGAGGLANSSSLT